MAVVIATAILTEEVSGSMLVMVCVFALLVTAFAIYYRRYNRVIDMREILEKELKQDLIFDAILIIVAIYATFLGWNVALAFYVYAAIDIITYLIDRKRKKSKFQEWQLYTKKTARRKSCCFSLVYCAILFSYFRRFSFGN